MYSVASLMLYSILYILCLNSYFPQLMSPYIISSGFGRLLDFLDDFIRVDFILEILLLI